MAAFGKAPPLARGGEILGHRQNPDHRFGPKLPRQPNQIVKSDGDAALRRGVILRRYVKKNSASPARLRWVVVMAQDNKDVVEIIRTPEFFVASRMGNLHTPVVVGIAGIVAPAVILGNRTEAKRGFKSVNAIGPVKNFPDRKIAGGRCPVALFFFRVNALSPQRALYLFPAPGKLTGGRYNDMGIQALRNDSVSPGGPTLEFA